MHNVSKNIISLNLKLLCQFLTKKHYFSLEKVYLTKGSLKSHNLFQNYWKHRSVFCLSDLVPAGLNLVFVILCTSTSSLVSKIKLHSKYNICSIIIMKVFWCTSNRFSLQYTYVVHVPTRLLYSLLSTIWPINHRDFFSVMYIKL